VTNSVDLSWEDTLREKKGTVGPLSPSRPLVHLCGLWGHRFISAPWQSSQKSAKIADGMEV
jgi:hypothetical protein